MCGIFAYLGGTFKENDYIDYFKKIQHRGPDNTSVKQINSNVWFGFHRLAIVGLDNISNQPFYIDGCWLICNGEIYNYKELQEKNKFDYKTHSDCEIIIHIYKKFGIQKTLEMLDGEFAFVIYDEKKDEMFVARDHLGVRGLYMGCTKDGKDLFFSSEAKSLTFCDMLEQFPPRSWWSSKNVTKFNTYSDFSFEILKDNSEKIICENIRKLITKAVEKRMMSDRKIGCLLSGGLDSSLVAGITAKKFMNPKNLETFSIGLKGSPDLANAQLVADFLGTKHHSVELKEEDFLNAIEDVVYQIGSYDVTTVRASVGHYLISNWVRKNSDVKVLLSGETSDEVAAGYLYFQNAPTPNDLQKETIRLLTDIHFFDMLRGDRSISSAGLEGRIPFSDKEFVKYYLSIPPELKVFNEFRMEKYLIRKAFENENIMPKEVLWRRKNGFSDGVSSKTRSWSVVIQEYVDKIISDDEYNKYKNEMLPNPPLIKEAYFIRKLFNKNYGKFQNLTPYQWLPKWSGNVVDPSARVLNIYKAD